MLNDQEVPQVCSLELLALHEIARKLWLAFMKQDSNNVFSKQSSSESFTQEEAFAFIYCRNKIVNSLSGTLPVGFPNSLKKKLVDAVINFQHGYIEALSWERKHQDFLPFVICKPAVAGQYAAIYFINPCEQFDDLSWSKRFVSDEDQPLLNRFIVATLYCFEETIYSLWPKMKAGNLVPGHGNMEHVQKTLTRCTSWWFDNMEKIEENGGGFTRDFYVEGFNKALYDWNECAARFFWNCCSAEEKNNLLTTNNFFQIGFHIHLGLNLRLINFVYSNLSEEQKRVWISEDSFNMALIWSHMLASYFRKTILKEILYFRDSISVNFFSLVLHYLVVIGICKKPAPVHNEVFIKIWNYLSLEEQISVLKARDIFWPLSTMLKNGIECELFEEVILPLPVAVKEEMLLEEWANAGHKLLHMLFQHASYDKLLCYLILFFLNYNAAARHKLTLRDDALSLLHRLGRCTFHVRFMQQISLSEVQKFNRILGYFRERLPAIDHLIKEETTVPPRNYRDFLSNKIYPLLSVEGKVVTGKIDHFSNLKKLKKL